MDTVKTNGITASFTAEELKILLHQLCDEQNDFTHQELIYWCEKYILHCQEYMLDEKKWQQSLMDEAEREEAKAFAVVQDMTRQWYAYMMQQCSSSDFDVESVPYLEMPRGWFVKWLNDLYISRLDA